MEIADAPLVPAEVDLTGLPFMPLLIDRLRRSKAWRLARKQPELGFYMINLWAAAWRETPAASLEDDDDVLMDAAMCSPAKWAKVKEGALYGFVRCTADGRLYHPTVAEEALKAWKGRVGYQERAAAARAAKLAKKMAAEASGTASVSETVKDVVKEPVTETKSEPVTKSVSGSVTELTTGLKSKGKGKVSPPSPPLANGRHVDKPEDVLFAFYEIRRLTWGNPVPGSYGPKELSIATDWLEKAGGDCEPIRALFAAEMKKMGERNAAPPGSPWFFHRSIDDAAASGWVGYSS